MAVAAPPPRKSRKGLIFGCLGLIVALSVICCAYDFYSVSQIERLTEEATATRGQGDCVKAVELYDQAINSKGILLGDTEVKQAESSKQVCVEFLDLVEVQKAGNYSEALVGYHTFINDYPNNNLHPTVRTQAQTIFTTAQPETVANETVCQNLEGLLSNELIPDPQTNLPLVYIGCGQSYYDAGSFSEAVAWLQKYMTDYPDHPRLEEVKPLLASALVAEAQALGAGNIPAPQETGGGGGTGPATIIIQNDSPEEMSLVFTGPETRFETLPPCEDCQEYTGDGPDACPEQGPIGTYELPAGAYDVVVKSISDAGVTPFTGNWEVGEGEEYYSCFFLITTP
jgi:tetratricopeptide (TPR) repeat protein